MATELFDVRKDKVLLQVHDFIVQNQKSTIKADFGFRISEFPNSWEEYDLLTKDWRKIINELVKVSPRPMLKFLVAVNIPDVVFQARPLSFNWGQYKDPEILLDCEPISNWINGFSVSDPNKETKYLDLIVLKKIFDISFDLQETLSDVYCQIDGDTLENQHANYFLHLGNIIQLKFELE